MGFVISKEPNLSFHSCLECGYIVKAIFKQALCSFVEQNDQVNVRLKAVRLLGRLFALPGQHVAKEYRQLFLEFLKRFTDKVADVRLTMIDCAKDCLRANPSGNEAAEILGEVIFSKEEGNGKFIFVIVSTNIFKTVGLDDRILDSEESIRLRTVVVVCELAKQNFKWIPISVLKHIAERLRDKKVYFCSLI